MEFRTSIKPDLQDFLLTDITAKELRVIAEAMEVDYLGPAVSLPRPFPAEGMIWAPNHRLMVPLVCQCRNTNKDSPPARIHILFLVQTGSPYTYLCQEAMEALIGKDKRIPQALRVKIQSEETSLEAHMSPRDSHFADVNVLGMDFLV